MQRLFRQLIPFIFAGIALVALLFGIVILAYLFFIGAVVGLIMFIFSYIKEKFFPSKKVTPTEKQSGRIIDSDDWKQL